MSSRMIQTEREGLFWQKSSAKKSWSNSEDMQLLQLIEEHGPSNWTLIAEKLVNRTGKQCRERFHNHLHPDVKKGEWSEEEDVTLAEMHHKLGNQWAKIAKFLPGRTDNAIKNRWHSAHRSYAFERPLAAQGPKRVVVPALELLPNVLQLEAETEGDAYHHSSHSHELTLSSRTDDSEDNQLASSTPAQPLSKLTILSLTHIDECDTDGESSTTSTASTRTSTRLFSPTKPTSGVLSIGKLSLEIPPLPMFDTGCAVKSEAHRRPGVSDCADIVLQDEEDYDEKEELERLADVGELETVQWMVPGSLRCVTASWRMFLHSPVQQLAPAIDRSPFDPSPSTFTDLKKRRV